jgi:hypothetical protein
VAEAVLQLLVEADVEGLSGAWRYEHAGNPITWRNDHRGRVLNALPGSLQLRIADDLDGGERRSGSRGLPRLLGRAGPIYSIERALASMALDVHLEDYRVAHEAIDSGDHCSIAW